MISFEVILSCITLRNQLFSKIIETLNLTNLFFMTVELAEIFASKNIIMLCLI